MTETVLLDGYRQPTLKISVLHDGDKARIAFYANDIEIDFQHFLACALGTISNEIKSCVRDDRLRIQTGD